MKKRTISDLRVKHLHADLGMAVGHASEILTGKKSPSLRLAVRLEDAYGIKPRAWWKTCASGTRAATPLEWTAGRLSNAYPARKR